MGDEYIYLERKKRWKGLEEGASRVLGFKAFNMVMVRILNFYINKIIFKIIKVNSS